MKLKRFLSLALSLAMLGAASPLALADGETGAGSDERLAAVTARVKETLDLDTEAYTDFSGALEEGWMAPVWRLSWNGEPGSLEISASESGQVISYYRYDADETWDSDSLSLPDGDPVQAKAAAEDFLRRVLAEGETAELDGSGDNALRQTSYRYRGTLLLNGLPSPVSYYVNVRASDCAVTRFYRDNLETEYIGSVPSGTFRTSEAEAGALLRDTLTLRLEYALNDDGETAVLRYLPDLRDSYYVDDATGELIDLTALYEELGGNRNYGDYSVSGDEAAMSTMDAGGAGLTEAEQLGADKLKGTLSGDALEEKARAFSELGLADYTLSSVSYREEELDGEAAIAARLIFAKKTDDGTCRRTVTLDARSGELRSVTSSMPWRDGFTPGVTEDEARSAAERFLSLYRRGRFDQCAAYEGDPGVWSLLNSGDVMEYTFTYAEQVNGYPYAGNALTVEIDAADGSVSGFSESWDEDVTFRAVGEIVTMDEAVDAYLDAFTVEGGYVSVPVALDGAYAALAELGYTSYPSLKLGYRLREGEAYVAGIDAETGKLVTQAAGEAAEIAYGDLDAAPWAKEAVETLAAYGIGYAGEEFQPAKTVTQLDLVLLLASCRGYRFDPEDLQEGEADAAYQAAYSMGALKRADRSDGKTLTRIEVLKMLLDAGGYGSAARLQGIYRTDFTDQAEVGEALLGYAALGQAMGVVQGDGQGRLAPNRAATRAEAAVMLYAFMEREV